MAIREVQRAKEHVGGIHRQLLHDLHAIPEEKRNWSPGGAATSAHQIVLSCAQLYREVAAALRGEKAESMVEPPASSEELRTDDVVAQADAALTEICGALDGLTEEEFSQARMMPWGLEMPVAEIVWFPSWNTGYHDGQLNYIQLLLGDTEFHWAG